MKREPGKKPTAIRRGSSVHFESNNPQERNSGSEGVTPSRERSTSGTTNEISRPLSEGLERVWQMQEAHEPDDIVWKHLATEEEKKKAVRAVSYGLMFVLLVLNSCIYIAFKVYTIKATEANQETRAFWLTIGGAASLAGARASLPPPPSLRAAE